MHLKPDPSYYQTPLSAVAVEVEVEIGLAVETETDVESRLDAEIAVDLGTSREPVTEAVVDFALRPDPDEPPSGEGFASSSEIDPLNRLGFDFPVGRVQIPEIHRQVHWSAVDRLQNRWSIPSSQISYSLPGIASNRIQTQHRGSAQALCPQSKDATSREWHRYKPRR